MLTDEARFAVAGTPAKSVSWRDVVDAERIEVAFDFEQAGPTFPSGVHAAVVEVDPETGAVRVLRFVAVDDCGRIVNPTIVEGQQHGGIVQGIAQALYEQVAHDDAGNPLTATFADYGIPSAAELPSIDAHTIETPSPVNPLGAKGIGQAGAIGSTPAVQNAVIDAVAHLGVRHIDLPLTPERWRPSPWLARAGRTRVIQSHALPQRAAQVAGPTTPSAGLRFFACWNLMTAAWVAGPKFPSAVPGQVPAGDELLLERDDVGAGRAELQHRPGRRVDRGRGGRRSSPSWWWRSPASWWPSPWWSQCRAASCPGTRVLLGTSVVPVACSVLTDLTPPSDPFFGTTASRITVAITASPITTIPRELNSDVSKAVSLETCAVSCAARASRAVQEHGFRVTRTAIGCGSRSARRHATNCR